MGMLCSKDQNADLAAAARETDRSGLRSNLVRQQTNRNPWFVYEKGDTLGSGHTGSVWRVTKKATGEQFALKSIKLNCIDESLLDDLRNEIELLKMVRRVARQTCFHGTPTRTPPLLAPAHARRCRAMRRVPRARAVALVCVLHRRLRVPSCVLLDVAGVANLCPCVHARPFVMLRHLAAGSARLLALPLLLWRACGRWTTLTSSS